MFYEEDDKNKKVNFNGDTLTFTKFLNKNGDLYNPV